MPISELKSTARYLIRVHTPSVYIISIMFIFLITVMTNLQVNLLGITEIIDSYFEQVASGNIASFLSYISFRPGSILLALAIWILISIVTVGYRSHCLKLLRDQETDFRDVFNGFFFFGKVLLLHLATRLFVALWSLLLVFPGLAAEYSYRLAYYILLDDPGKGVMQCIRESKQLMHGWKLELFYLDLSFLGWDLLDTAVTVMLSYIVPISLPIVLIWLTPYTHLANAAFYNHLRSNPVLLS